MRTHRRLPLCLSMCSILATMPAAMLPGGSLAAQGRVTPNTPRPIDAGSSLWAEELTFMEIRDLVKAGTTTIVIGTGGVEQNGPYVASGKHNFVLLTDICRSYAAHGFQDVVLIGDSGGNQLGMEHVAKALNARWIAEGKSARVHFLPEYYRQDQWSYEYLKSQGIVQIDSMAAAGQARDRPADTRNGMHDDIYYEAQIAVQSPELIRAPQRAKAGQLTLHGVDLSNMKKTVELGRQLAAYRADITAKAFEKSRGQLRTPR